MEFSAAGPFSIAVPQALPVAPVRRWEPQGSRRVAAGRCIPRARSRVDPADREVARAWVRVLDLALALVLDSVRAWAVPD